MTSDKRGLSGMTLENQELAAVIQGFEILKQVGKRGDQ